MPDAIVGPMRGVKWVALPGWESMSDGEIATRSGLFAARLAGVLFVVTDATLASQRGAFQVDAEGLAMLVEEHLDRYGECLFNGDTIVVERDGSRIWLFHHEGVYATVSVS
jgi:hypothetical protein